MSERDEWSEWFRHDGAGVPASVRPGMIIQAEMRRNTDGSIRTSEGQLTDEHLRPIYWMWGTTRDDLMRFRIRKPRGLTILESLLSNLPETVDA